MVDLLSWQPVPKAEDRRVVINPHAKEAHVKSRFMVSFPKEKAEI